MQKKPASDDQRIIKRHQLPLYLQVYNRVTGRPLGYIVNISSQGMMLVSQAQLMTHAVFQLSIHIPDKSKTKKIDFEALSLWSRSDVTPGYYDTGFSFIRAPEELIELVSALKDYFSFRDVTIS